MRGSLSADQGLAKALTRMEKRIHAQLTSGDAFVRQLLRYTAAARGKRLRARLTLLSAAAVGRLHPGTERLAAAMELLHQATLAHDDVIDHAASRRHRPTLNARFGNETAVLVGDLMFAQAMNLLMADESRVLHRIVAQAATRVCLGEIQELQFFQKRDLAAVAYLNMIAHKTASLLEACCAGGAVTARGTAREARALGAYGRALGMAFQIQDDLLDVSGEKKRTGKPVGLDIQEGRMTLPFIYGFKAGSAAQRRSLARELAMARPNLRRLKSILEASGALDQCRRLAETYAGKARAALKPLRDTAAKRRLLALAGFAVERDH
jgi:octaprenyl-diphosphate synthase